MAAIPRANANHRPIPVGPQLGETIRQWTFEAAWCRHTTSDRTPHNRYDSSERPCSLRCPHRRRLDRGGDAAGYAGRTTTFVLIGVRE
jgi:hypothetical protein